MKAYIKYVFRDAKNLFLKLLALVLIVMLGVGFLIGLVTTTPNMRFSMEKYYEDYKAADAIIQSPIPFTNEQLENLKNHVDVDEIMPYFVIEEEIVLNNANQLSRITLLDFEEGININKLELIEGRLPLPNDEKIEVVVERSQVYLIDIPIGYETDYDGDIFEVVGIVQHPWDFSLSQEISPFSNKVINAIIYTDYRYLEKSVFTHVALKFKNSEKHSIFSNNYENLIKQKVENLKNEHDGFYYKTLNQNPSFVTFQSDIKIVEIISLIFPVFFFLVTILVSISSTNKIILDQRIQIGTLRSLGYSKISIILKYAIFVVVASGLGSLLGIGAGIYFIPAIIYNAYLNSYFLPKLLINYHFLYISVISLAMVFSVLITTLFSVIATLREKPSDLMKTKVPKVGKKVFLERVTFIWKRLKFKYKSTIRNIFRHRRNLILTLIGISGSTALLFAGFGIKDSVSYSGKYQYELMMNYDLEVGIINANENMDLLDDYENIQAMVLKSEYEDGKYINVFVPRETTEIKNYLKFENLNKEEVFMETNSVFLTKQIAEKLNIKKFDSLSIEINEQIFDLEVTEIVNHYFDSYIYIAKEVYEVYQMPIFNKIYIKSNLEDAALEDLIDQLKINENVTNVLSKEDIKYSFDKTSESMNNIIVVLVFAACALAIIVNYNLTLISISSRQKEIATLKVIGYQEKEVTGYIFRETALISTVAVALGILMGFLLHRFIISQIHIEGIVFDPIVNWLSYILTIVLSYVFLFIVYLLSIPKTKKIDMVEALKSYE